MRHIPPAGQSILVHTASATCPCNPQKSVNHISRSSGKRGGHQGYRQEITYRHNILVREEA